MTYTKLEILSIYLPHKLKVKIAPIGDVGILIGIRLLGTTQWFTDIELQKQSTCVPTEHITPLLRSIDDIDKEIDGIVMSEEIGKILVPLVIDRVTLMDKQWFQKIGREYLNGKRNAGIKDHQQIQQLLLSNHFNIFNLYETQYERID